MAAPGGPKRLALGCVLLLASAAALEGAFVQSLGRVCPVDEAVGIELLARFREQLRDAVKERDVEMLRPLVDPGIVVGGLSQQFKVGFEAFLDHFEFRDRSNSIWIDVGGVLSQGGILEGDDPSLLLRIGKKAGQWRLIHLQGTD